MEEHDPQIRSAVAKTLGLLGDKNAIPPLRNALPDWLAQETFIEGLVKLGWHPQSNEERVYLWVARKDGESLKKHWDIAKRVLISDLKSTQRKCIENSTYTFISLGIRDSIGEMIQILNIHGNTVMAETYLNSGYEYLENAARRWAEEKGYSIVPGSGAQHASWGSW